MNTPDKNIPSQFSNSEETKDNESSTIQRTTTDALFAGHKELIIEHGDEKYRLRITSKGKLILTK